MDITNGEIHLESALHKIGDEAEEEVCILVDGNNYIMVDNGVNIIIYNEATNQLIDVAGDDVYLGMEMVHGNIEKE